MTACRDCSEPLEPFSDDGDGPYRTGDENGRCAECNAHRLCVCCGEPYRFDPLMPEIETCTECSAETAAYFRERYEAGCLAIRSAQ